MKISKSLLLLFVFLLAGCQEGDLITCSKGKNNCSGITNTLYSAPSIAGKFTFGQGSDYQNYWAAPYDQVNKLFGATDCGELISSTQNSAMVGFRHIAQTSLVELVGYNHRQDATRNGVNFRHAHLMTLPISSPVELKISVKNSYYHYSANGTYELLMKRFCDGTAFNGRKIGTWFGGQRPAPVQIKIAYSNSISTVSQFPKLLNLMDQDDLCSKGLDALDYLKTHSSGLYASYQSECRGKLQAKYLGCDNRMNSDSYQGISPNSDPGFRFLISCIP